MGFMNIFKRGSKIVEANANAAIDKMENPVLMTEQAIRDMTEQIGRAIKAQAGVKKRALKLKAEVATLKTDSAEWTAKAVKLKAKYKATTDADTQAAIKDAIVDCLNKVENLDNEAASKSKISEQTAKKSDDFGKRIKTLRDNVEAAKSSLEDLRTRSEVAKAEKEVNEELAGIGDDTAMNMIKKMQDKVAGEEAEAEAYAEIADEDKPLDSKIVDLLGADSPTENNKLLDDFMND